MNNVPTDPAEHPSSTSIRLATDVEHDDAGCTTCNPRWTPKLPPCPPWCTADHSNIGEEVDEINNIRAHTSTDLILIRRATEFGDRDVVSACVSVADNATDGTRGEAGIMVETGDMLTPGQVRQLIAALHDGLRILDEVDDHGFAERFLEERNRDRYAQARHAPDGYTAGYVDGYANGRKAGYADGDADGFNDGFAAGRSAYQD